ncbi:ferredoxin [Rhodococcus sp. NPDC060086]|uniref:ferredoxin n=1 Tax=unclassified Rhodococcus (in: high G+C Gram-positive bacteria) TaxID=192944 RepID=UPI00365DF001
MDVEVDFDRCEANGVCVGIAPDVFDLNDDDELIVVHPVPAGSEDLVRDAIAQCPRAALSEVSAATS